MHKTRITESSTLNNIFPYLGPRLLRFRLCWLIVVFAFQLSWTFNSVIRADEPSNPNDAQSLSFFEQHIRPLLIERCVQCHGEEKQEGGLRLDSSQAVERGGDSGAAIDRSHLDQSLLLAAVRYEGPEMPPSGQLPADDVEMLEQWVARGAPWPTTDLDTGELALRARGEITDEDRDYWAFRPLQTIEPPQLNTVELIAGNDVDRFLLERLQLVGLSYSPPADRRTLVRRLYLDLVGVPPTREELAAFLADARPDAYEQLILQLQADSRYGEKWSRFWLDLVRYAESDGFNQDADRSSAYLYRDWLISALNADLPYDEFVAAQLAGDELAPHDPQMLAATGFLRHWIYEYNQRDARSQRSNILNDLTDVTGEVFFGVGIGCARCHDHKFDPLLQEDYYRLQAAFADFLPADDNRYGSPDEIEQYQRQLSEWESGTREIRQRIQTLEAADRKRVADAAYNKFPLDIRPMLFKPTDERDGFEQQIADLADRQVQLEWDKLDFSKLLQGDDKLAWEEAKQQLAGMDSLRPKELPRIRAAGKVLGPTPAIIVPSKPSVGQSHVRFVAFHVQESRELLELDAAPHPNQAFAPENRRTALAAWINSPQNSLTHRVIVNRIWQELFGVGLVRNANDFGRLGEPPSHPQLLDWLSQWFINDGKSLKRLQFMLLTSQAYRQSTPSSSEAIELGMQIDWENRLLWRFPTRRLQAEQLRDSMLVACSCLEPMTGGPSKPHDARVRSVYTQVKRNRPHPFLAAFDVPDRSTSVGRRLATTTVNQSLLLNNSEWTLKLATDLSRKLLSRASEPELHLQAAFERMFARTPTAAELETLIDYMHTTSQRLAAASNSERAATFRLIGIDTISFDQRTELPWYQTNEYAQALADVCHVLMNSSEFLYVD